MSFWTKKLNGSLSVTALVGLSVPNLILLVSYNMSENNRKKKKVIQTNLNSFFVNVHKKARLDLNCENEPSTSSNISKSNEVELSHDYEVHESSRDHSPH